MSYHYVSRESFVELVQQDGFIEHAEFSGNMYGTSVKSVEDVKRGGKMCILDIDTQVRTSLAHPLTLPLSRRGADLPRVARAQGVKLIKANHPHLDPLYVFISPPSLASLKTRLSGRGTESESSMQARLAAAVGEIDYAKSGAFDVVVVNDELERAYAKLRKVVVERDLEAGDQLPDFAAEQ